jgi:hypothetical protein
MHRILREVISNNEDRIQSALDAVTPNQFLGLIFGVLKGEDDDSHNEMTASELLASLPEEISNQIYDYYKQPRPARKEDSAKASKNPKPVVP